VIDILYDRYRNKGFTDAQAKAKIWAILHGRIESGRLTQEAAVKHWTDANRAFGLGNEASSARPSLGEAREMDLTERDRLWPKRGLHPTEKHHPLMQGVSFRRYWQKRGFSNQEIEEFVVKIDTDIHRAISSAPPGGQPWWDSELIGRIDKREKKLRRKLKKSEVMDEVNVVLQKLAEFSPE
jgi:hypothetical protein